MAPTTVQRHCSKRSARQRVAGHSLCVHPASAPHFSILEHIAGIQGGVGRDSQERHLPVCFFMRQELGEEAEPEREGASGGRLKEVCPKGRSLTGTQAPSGPLVMTPRGQCWMTFLMFSVLARTPPIRRHKKSRAESCKVTLICPLQQSHAFRIPLPQGSPSRVLQCREWTGPHDLARTGGWRSGRVFPADVTSFQNLSRGLQEKLGF